MYSAWIRAVLALPSLLSCTSSHPLSSRATTAPITVTAAQLQTIAPSSSSCNKVSQYADECVTATQAAGFINDALATYAISSAGEAAAVIATIAKESGEFKYARHHFGPVQPGQGTRNMQMPHFNLMYAQSIPALQAEVAAASGDPSKILDVLIQYGDIDFGSAMWYLTTQCARTRSALASGSDDAWSAYVSCVGASPADGRLDYWHKAVQALGVGKS